MKDFATDALANLELNFQHQREKLLKQIDLSKALPTNGVVVTFIGEDGWDKEGKAKPPVEKQSGIVPHIFHDLTAYKVAKHVAYRAPDGSKFDGGQGESSYSKYRDDFVKKYVMAVIEAYRPFMIETIAWKGPRYLGTYFPDNFDATQLKNYHDAKKVAAGMVECRVTQSAEHGYTSGTFSFYVDLPEQGKLKVDIEMPDWHMLAPRAHGVDRCSCSDKITKVTSWHPPKTIRQPANMWSYGSGDHCNLIHTLDYLFRTVEDALFSLGLQSENV